MRRDDPDREARPALVAAGALAAVLAGWGAWAVYPAVGPADDPFRSTLAVVPAVCAALAWIGRRAARETILRPTRGRSGRRARRMGLLEGLLWLAVLLSLPFRHALGWPYDDAPWAAVLVLALATTTARRLLDLRPLLRPGSTRPSALFFLLPLVIYLAIQPWALERRPANGDEPYNLLLAHSLAYDLDIDLDNQYAAGDSLRFADRDLGPQEGDPVARGGARRSRHNAFLPVLLAPGYRVAGRAGAAATMAVLTAALAWLFLRLALRSLSGATPEDAVDDAAEDAVDDAAEDVVDDAADGAVASRKAVSGAFLAWAAVAFLPPLLLYAHQIWVEVPAALLLAFAVDRLWSLRRRRRDRDLLLFVVALVLLPLLKLRLLLLAAPLLLLALPSQRREPRRLALLLALPGLAVGAMLAFNAWAYGNPFKLYTSHEVQTFLSTPVRHLRGLVGIFWDCAFGLFAFAPLWMLLLPGLALFLRRRDAPPGVLRREHLRLDLAVLAVPYLLALAPRLEWYGGWAPPFRYPLVLLPLLGLLLIPVLARRRRAGLRFLWVLLGLPTLLLALIWTVTPSWTYHLADGSQQILQLAGSQLGADVSRLFPSTVRPRPATWIWVAASLLTIPLAFAGGRSRHPFVARHAGSLAVGVLFAFLVAVPWAAETLPSRHVEVEDAWVGKHGGTLHPERWRLRRPEVASGWFLGAGAWLEIPVSAGGREVVVDVRATRVGRGPNVLQVERLGDDGTPETLASFTLDERGRFADHPAPPVPWAEGDRLVVRNAGTGRGGGLVIDWVDLCWRGDPCWETVAAQQTVQEAPQEKETPER